MLLIQATSKLVSCIISRPDLFGLNPAIWRDFCLIDVSAVPCTAGVTTIRTGTGVVVPLWAEKSTQPSLCVKYNDMVCYANLEIGTATEAININYNDIIYHTVD